MNSPNEIAERFADGDYMSVALHGTPDQWQYFAARGLITHPRDAIRSLENFDDPDARFYSAVLSWMAGDDDEACRQWEAMAGIHARNMLAFVRKPKIDVLSMLPPLRHGPFVLSEGITHDPKFRVRNLGSLPGDVPTRPDARISEFVDFAAAPDFFVCNMIEWHQIPIDIRLLPCPTIGFTNDFDMHIQGVHRWFHAFDSMVVIDQVVEHPAIRRLSGMPTYAYPMVFGIPSDLPKRPERERDIDIFMSGTMLSAYHPDKARLLHQLLDIQGVKMLIVDGHLGVENYWDLLSRSKITPSFCRHPGGIQTRVMESLALGSISLVQPESIMQLWAGETEGLFVFDEEIGPELQIRRILANFDHYAAGCRANARKLQSVFEPNTIASRFFRFCTFMAARPGGPRDPRRHELLSQKRVMFVHGPRLKSDGAIHLANANSVRLLELSRTHRSAEFLIAHAREWMLLYADGSYYGELKFTNPKYLQLAIQHGREAVAAYPDSLVAHYNLMRTLFHFGSFSEIDEAINLANEIVTKQPNRWQVDPADDVCPYDFFSDWFNYRRYLDTVVDILVGRCGDTTALRSLLLASIHHYLAVVQGSLEHAERAYELDPEFPIYSLRLAEMLAHADDASSRDRATDILLNLARSSMVARRAYLQLLAIEERRIGRIPAVAALDDRFARVPSAFLQTEHHTYKVFAPYFVFDNLRTGGRHGAVVHNETIPDKPWLSIVVCGQAGVGCEPIFRNLMRWRAGRNFCEFVYVDCFGQPPSALIDLADTTISLDQRQFLENRGLALRTALGHIHSDVVVFIEPGESIDLFPIERLVKSFYEGGVIQEVGIARSVPRPIVVVSADARKPGKGRFVAARASDVEAVRGFSPHELLLGDGPILEELVERLVRNGAKVEINGHDALLPPWWQSDRLLKAPHVVEIARSVWPLIFDERRTDPVPDLPAVYIDSANSNNIVHFYDRYFVIPQALGPVNLENASERLRPGILTAQTLADARALAQGHAPLLLDTINFHNIVRFDDRYFVIPQSMGTVNLENSDERQRSGILVARTLTEARAMAKRMESPAALYGADRRAYIMSSLLNRWTLILNRVRNVFKNRPNESGLTRPFD